MLKIDAIRNSIIGAQTVNWSEHIYPLVAALEESGRSGVSHELAKANVGTLIEQATKLEEQATKLEARVAELENTKVRRACPCLHTTSCDPECTCIKGSSSMGCYRCCTYGSSEQQKAKAERLAQRIDTLRPITAK